MINNHATKEIEAAIAEQNGSVRDALNVALTRLAAEAENVTIIAGLMSELKEADLVISILRSHMSPTDCIEANKEIYARRHEAME